MKRVLSRLPIVGDVVRVGRPGYRRMRTKYLRWRYPLGGYTCCNGVRVFCNFRDPSYVWYDADAPNLAFDQRVISSLIAQSEGSVFIDIGAHFGFFSAYLCDALAARTAPAEVIALEPDQEHFRCLHETMKPYANRNVRLLPFAISDSDGFVTMYKTNAICLHSYEEADAVSCYQVASISLDSLARDYVDRRARIAFIKVDTDGAEALFMRGAKASLREHKPIIFVEFAPYHLRKAGVEPGEFFRSCCEMFRVYVILYDTWNVRRVDRSDYAEIVRRVDDRVADLVLSSVDLSFP